MHKSVGFIGLGNMGLPMAQLLLKDGYQVLGMDLNEAACQSLIEHGGSKSSYKEIIELTETIILMLPNSHIVNEVISELRAAHLNAEKRNAAPITLIDMSSSSPADTQRNARILSEIGIAMLDAPVSGGVKKAVTGELTIMVGGDKEAFAQQAPLLKVFGKNLYHVGPIGSGHLLKSLNNYLSAVHMLATCEAVHVLSSFGIDPHTGVEIFNRSTGRSGSTDYKFPEFVLPETYNSGFSLELLAKDIDIAKGFMQETGESTPLINLVSDSYKAAGQFLEPKADHTEIYRYVSTYIHK